MLEHIFILALHEQGKILQETYECLSCADDMAGPLPSLIVLADTKTLSPLSQELAEKTGLEVIAIDTGSIDAYCAELYIKTLTAYLRDKSPFHIIIPHTSQGADCAPQLAHGLDACCITAVEGIEEGRFARSMFGGRVKALHSPSRTSAVLTVMPGAWKPAEPDRRSIGTITVVFSAERSLSTRTSGIKESMHTNTALTVAEVIISAGRGIGKAQNMANLALLQTLFPRSALGASRAVCDLGWLDYTHQVGSTGNKVAPKLYFACGISGALQHLAGMKNSRVIVAVNTDPNASIFTVADYCIVEDVNAFIPLFVNLYDDRHRKKP